MKNTKHMHTQTKAKTLTPLSLQLWLITIGLQTPLQSWGLLNTQSDTDRANYIVRYNVKPFFFFIAGTV